MWKYKLLAQFLFSSSPSYSLPPKLLNPSHLQILKK
jgi:hypothetical protein